MISHDKISDLILSHIDQDGTLYLERDSANALLVAAYFWEAHCVQLQKQLEQLKRWSTRGINPEEES